MGAKSLPVAVASPWENRYIEENRLKLYSVQESRFVERMLTVVATCRQQGGNVSDYLTSCFEASRRGQAIPSLLPVIAAKIKAA